jgi:2-polyprenyl-6-methoxyphenol hydroxylase-like FAD-dependent oxidoreductase
MFLFLNQTLPTKTRYEGEDLKIVLREQLNEYGGLIARVRDQISDASDINYRPMDWIWVPAPWHDGRVVLIGDAVHSTTPHLATGAGIAIEDAVVLAEELGKGERLSQAITQFMERRYERCEMVVQTALQLSRMEQDPKVPDHELLALSDKAFSALTAPI